MQRLTQIARRLPQSYMNKSNSSAPEAESDETVNTVVAQQPAETEPHVSIEYVDVETDNSETDYLLQADNDSTGSLFRANSRKSTMEARNEHQLHKQFQSLSVFNSLVGSLLVALVLIWCTHYRGGFAWHSNYGLQFNWHPLLMTFGLIFLYSQSMLMYRMKRYMAKSTLKRVHAAIHIIAFICAVIGLKAVFDFHNYSKPPKPNLYSLHSWIGLTAVIIFALQYVLGFTTFLFPGLSNEIRKFSLPIHVATGTATFFFCVVAAFMGFTEKIIWTPDVNYSELPGEAVLVNFIGVMLAVFAALSLYLVNNPDYKRHSQEDEQIVITEHTE